MASGVEVGIAHVLIAVFGAYGIAAVLFLAFLIALYILLSR